MQELTDGNIRRAATLLLLREYAHHLEVFMVQRPGGAVFPDLHVFPGGKVDVSDATFEFCEGLSPDDAEQQLGVPGGLRYWVTAIRECFEECGVLLSNHLPHAVDTQSKHLRQQLIEGQLSMADFCKNYQLRLDCTALRYFSHWLTPESAPRRFDTRFFVAEMPSSQQALHHDDELVAGEWIAVEQALANYRSGKWQMISPTIVSLEMLLPFATIKALFAAIAKETHLPELTEQLQKEGMCRSTLR